METRALDPAADSPGRSSVDSVVILVVDDNSSMLQIASQFLEEFGYTILTAGSGFEAELLFAERRGQVDLLLTDLDLGDCSGIDLASSLRRGKPSLKVLVISGRPDLSEVIGLRNADFPHLGKPFTKNQLVQKVAELVGRTEPGRSSFADAQEL